MPDQKARRVLVDTINALTEGAIARLGEEEVAVVVREIVENFSEYARSSGLDVAKEIEDLARYIQNAKKEIAALRPDLIAERYIPTAADELDAIVKTTEEATNTIMAAAESIESTAKALDGDATKTLNAAVTSIYEACCFQDITGQRIGKVVETLQHIENKINTLVAALGRPGVRLSPDDADDRPAQKDSLLNGPQQPGEGRNQDEIDAILNGAGGSFDSIADEPETDPLLNGPQQPGKGRSQDEIDAIMGGFD